MQKKGIKMKKIYILMILAVMCSVFVPVKVSAQYKLTPEMLKKLFPPAVVSPQYNADGSVTFRFQAPEAQKVELNCQMLKKNEPMVKDEKGVWSVTVTPEKPDIYPYCFVVDGTSVTDPNNINIFPNEQFKNSLVDVRGAEPSVQDMQNVPHGKIAYRYYHSRQLGFDRPLCIYTPAGYNPNGKENYPVLYLIHGMTDTYETWFKVGKVNLILDNLIAQGKALKMIIVMPYANPYPEMNNRGINVPYNPMGTDTVANEIIKDVIPFVENNYQVVADADHRGIAGFSLGGRQTLATGLGNPELFHWVCAFSPAIFGDEMNTNFGKIYASPELISKNLKLMWVSCGTDDGLCSAAKALDKALTDRNIVHEAHFTDGAHTWMNCRKYIAEVAKKIFR